MEKDQQDLKYIFLHTPALAFLPPSPLGAGVGWGNTGWGCSQSQLSLHAVSAACFSSREMLLSFSWPHDIHPHHRKQSTCECLQLMWRSAGSPSAELTWCRCSSKSQPFSGSMALCNMGLFCIAGLFLSLCSSGLPLWLSGSCRVSACQPATAQREMALPACLPNLLLTHLHDCMVVSSALPPRLPPPPPPQIK